MSGVQPCREKRERKELSAMLVKKIKDAEIQMIHEKSLEILECVGVNFEHQEVLEIFQKNGIRVEGQRVFFERSVVKEMLAGLKSSFTLQTPFTTLKIGEGGKAIATASGAMTILKNGDICTPTVNDYIDLRKMDEMSSLVNLCCVPGIYASNLPDGKVELLKTVLSLKYSRKPLIASCETGKSAAESIEFIRDFYGDDRGEYFTIGVENLISPLRYSREDVAAILAYIKRNQPVVITCCSAPGMTSPITVGGTIVQNNAEVLAGIVMTQIVNPGVPVVYGNVSYSADMRKAVPISWGPEVAVFMQYAKAMADFYGIPSRVGGSLSGAKQLDWQDGAETAISLMTTFDCDTDFIFHAFGEMDCLNVFSMEKYILDEELLEARFSVENCEYITEEAIHMDMIKRVGPGGTYMLEDETLELYQTALFRPRLFNSETYYNWKQLGMPSVILKTQDVVKERLAEYQPPVYNERQTKMLDELLEVL